MGTRAERMTAYVPREKAPKTKKRELKEMELSAKFAGKPFDAVAYSLSEISKENPSTAEFIRELVKRNILEKDNVTKLFISGSLTQKLFQKAANDEDFKKMFGAKQVNLLARGLAYIGPLGRQTEGARRAFQGRKGKELFGFLEKKGYIDTSHGKGNTVTYLARI